MKPGDLFQWVYKDDNTPIVDGIPNMNMWSTTMQRFVPIGGIALLVSVTGDTYTWLYRKQLYSVRMDDLKGKRGARFLVV